jgi:hypothetical protein
VAKLCPPVDVRAIANWSNEQRHSRMCAPDGFHRLDRACIGSQLPKLPSLQSIGLTITGLAPLTAGPTRRGAKLGLRITLQSLLY